MVKRPRRIQGALFSLVLLVAACTEGAGSTTSEGSESTSTSDGANTTGHDQATSTISPEPIVRETVMITEDQSYPDGVVIPADESWVLDPEQSITLTASGNVEVLGELVMQPASGDVEHVLRFEGVDESVFVGGGMDPVPSDVGLWVMGDGQLLIEGGEKQAWGYEYDPAWAGDEVMAAPNTPGDYTGFESVTATPPANDLEYPAELLNLTRNVRIEGTEDGFTHVFIRSTRPQTIRYAALRYVAPRLGESDVTGRYGIHIHMCGEGSRGSLIEGVVIRDAGNHAFVPHASNGITFRDTIAFNVLNEAYWWDPPGDDEDGPINASHDIVWDRAVVAGLDLGDAGNRFRLTGFFLGDGENLTVTNSVAVGVQGGEDRSGFLWPESSRAVWTFENNIAHNNQANGIFVWQNNPEHHVIDGFTAYYNSWVGVDHGAYENAYQYRNLTLLENESGAVVSHALGEEAEHADTQIWSNIVTNGSTLYVAEHRTELEEPVRFIDCDFGRVEIEEDDSLPGAYDFINCGLEPADFDIVVAEPDSVFRVQNEDGSVFQLTGDGSVTEIEPFFNG